jgi:hypothetical protein
MSHLWFLIKFLIDPIPAGLHTGPAPVAAVLVQDRWDDKSPV